MSDCAELAHQFLLEVLPFRDPDSRDALAAFVNRAAPRPVPAVVLDAILLRCLIVLNRHAGDPLPSLVETYLARARDTADPWVRFADCVGDALKYRGVGDLAVQHAIALLDDRCQDPRLTSRTLAGLVGRRPAALAVAFKRHTGSTIGEYLRRTRLDRACRLLTLSTMSIKEAWTQAGYNYGSNFNHDFKRRFGLSPRAYRARAIRPRTGAPEREAGAAVTTSRSATGRVVLIVDQRAGADSTLCQGLRQAGLAVFTAASGRDALREVDRLSPHVVLLEYQLPDMSGVACLRALRCRHARWPAVGVFTADWDVYDDAAEIQALNGLVASKPCGIAEVQELIVRLVYPAHIRVETATQPTVPRT